MNNRQQEKRRSKLSLYLKLLDNWFGLKQFENCKDLNYYNGNNDAQILKIITSNNKYLFLDGYAISINNEFVLNNFDYATENIESLQLIDEIPKDELNRVFDKLSHYNCPSVLNNEEYSIYKKFKKQETNNRSIEENQKFSTKFKLDTAQRKLLIDKSLRYYSSNNFTKMEHLMIVLGFNGVSLKNKLTELTLKLLEHTNFDELLISENKSQLIIPFKIENNILVEFIIPIGKVFDNNSKSHNCF